MARIAQQDSLGHSILDEITGIDYQGAAESITDFLRSQREKSGSDGFVFGLSGGVDSAVLAALCAKSGEKTTAFIMPDSGISPSGDTKDALELADLLGMEYRLVDIRPILKEYSKYIEPDERAAGNLRARIRADILYHYANSKNRLVLGSSDKSEWLVGYFTKFGDGASDVAPISSLYKLQVRGMGRHLGVPQGIIAKKSSPHLWANHDAEEELGASYEQIDQILYCMERMPPKEIAKKCGMPQDTVDRILELNRNSEHKRGAQAAP